MKGKRKVVKDMARENTTTTMVVSTMVNDQME